MSTVKNKLVPYSLTLLETHKRGVNRDGDEVRFVAFVDTAKLSHRVVVCITKSQNHQKVGEVYAVSSRGFFNSDDKTPSKLDLTQIQVPVKYLRARPRIPTKAITGADPRYNTHQVSVVGAFGVVDLIYPPDGWKWAGDEFQMEVTE